MKATTRLSGFAALLSYESFKTFLQASAEVSEAKANRDVYSSFYEEAMAPALVLYMKQLHAAGRLVRMDGYEGRHFSFLDSWNAILDGATEDYLWGRVSHDLAHWFLFRAYHQPMKRVRGGEDFESVASEAWNSLIQGVETCVIDPIEFRGNIRCQTTGEPLYVGFENWKPSVWILTKDIDVVRAGPVAAPGIETVDITFPTGHLLIADWLHIPAFIKAGRAKDFDFNCDRGKREAVKWYAEELGLAHVFVGNTCPGVLKYSGGFVVGPLVYDEETDDTVAPAGTTEIGSICTDLWWATITDRETVLGILTRKMSREAAETELAAYLKKNEVVQVQVEPGRWRLSFCGETGAYSELAVKSGLIPAGLEAFFTLMPCQETPDAV